MGLADRTPPTAEEYAAWRTEFCNWGRWGDDDEFGTLNLVTPEVRRAAATLVREGRSVSLGRPLDTHASPANPYPAHHFVAVEGSGGMLDYVGCFVHGFTQTHIDALCHLGTLEGDVFWNNKPFGHSHLPADHTGTVDFWRDGISTRGVLYDIPRLRDTFAVVPGEPVHGWELVDFAEQHGITPRPGDAVIIRSGFEPYYATTGADRTFGFPAGVHASCVEFLHETGASLLAWDMQDAPIADQGIPNPAAHHIPMHVHAMVLPYLGMPIVDNCDLEDVARACAELDRWEFHLTIAPLVITRGTGSPVNPIALF
ncbi:MAG: cyclase family protein [Actinomycetes bacterium]